MSEISISAFNTTTKVFWLGTNKVVLWFQIEINTSVSYF